jgi:hypothetical protein
MTARVAEAMYLRVPNPDRSPGSEPGEGLMDKVGEYSSPLDQADGAGKGLQYVTSGLAYAEPTASGSSGSSGSAGPAGPAGSTGSAEPRSSHDVMIVESLDAGLVRWGTPLPFPTPLRCESRC